MSATSTPAHRAAAAEIKQEAMERLSAVSMLAGEGRLRDIAYEERIMVGQHQIRQTLDCPARAAMPSEFAWTPIFTMRRLAKAALSRALDDGTDTWEPVDLLRAESKRIMATGQPDNFEEWFQAESAAVRAQCVVHAAGHMTQLLNTLGDPLPNGTRIGADNRDAWTYPDRGLQLKGRPDVTAGRLRGSADEREFWVLVGADNEIARSIIAFEALVATLSVASRPAGITMVAGSSGVTHRFEVTDALLQEGIDVAVPVAETIAVSLTGGTAGLDRRPGFFTCRGCPEAKVCAPRAEYEASPPTARGGLPAL